MTVSDSDAGREVWACGVEEALGARRRWLGRARAAAYRSWKSSSSCDVHGRVVDGQEGREVAELVRRLDFFDRTGQCHSCGPGQLQVGLEGAFQVQLGLGQAECEVAVTPCSCVLIMKGVAELLSHSTRPALKERS